MSAIPANQKLWRMLTQQARSKFRVYPSPAASHWVHQQYVQHGGRFVESTKELAKKDREEHRKADSKKGKK